MPCTPRAKSEMVEVGLTLWPDCRFSTPQVFTLRSLMRQEIDMIRKLKDGRFRLYSRKADPKTGRRRNLGTFRSKDAAEKHERAVQFFKRRG
jgi:hypothetical protein